MFAHSYKAKLNGLWSWVSISLCVLDKDIRYYITVCKQIIMDKQENFFDSIKTIKHLPMNLILALNNPERV